MWEKRRRYLCKFRDGRNVILRISYALDVDCLGLFVNRLREQFRFVIQNEFDVNSEFLEED